MPKLSWQGGGWGGLGVWARSSPKKKGGGRCTAGPLAPPAPRPTLPVPHLNHELGALVAGEHRDIHPGARHCREAGQGGHPGGRECLWVGRWGGVACRGALDCLAGVPGKAAPALRAHACFCPKKAAMTAAWRPDELIIR